MNEYAALGKAMAGVMVALRDAVSRWVRRIGEAVARIVKSAWWRRLLRSMGLPAKRVRTLHRLEASGQVRYFRSRARLLKWQRRNMSTHEVVQA